MLTIYQQINAGAVVLTDLIFWVIFVPFLEMKQYNVNLVNLIIRIESIMIKTVYIISIYHAFIHEFMVTVDDRNAFS